LKVAPQELFSCALRRPLKSDSQTFATLGAAGVDHGPAATSLHAYQEAVSTGSANLGRLVSAFHMENPKVINDQPATNLAASHRLVVPNEGRVTLDYRKLSQLRQYLTLHTACTTGTLRRFPKLVDKTLIIYNSRSHK
jgi:hypothetical protein